MGGSRCRANVVIKVVGATGSTWVVSWRNGESVEVEDGAKKTNKRERRREEAEGLVCWRGEESE